MTTGLPWGWSGSWSLGEGNYRLSLPWGETSHFPQGTAPFQVWAQGNRFMGLVYPHSPRKTLEIVVNLRSPGLPSPSEHEPGKDGVILHPGEGQHPRWSTTLTLAFTRPNLASLNQPWGFVPPHANLTSTVTQAPDLPTLYLVGDSTVCDQGPAPGASWGQMVPAFFDPAIAVANHAESGETIKSFVTALRWQKVLTTLHPGDFVAIQFGHNDQKPGRPLVYAEPKGVFPSWLRVLCSEVSARGAQPILVTSVERRNFDELGKVVESHGAYPDAVRTLALDLKVPLIDMQKISIELYEDHGHEGSVGLFRSSDDRTHHNFDGAFYLATGFVRAIKEACPSLATFLLSPEEHLPALDTPPTWAPPIRGDGIRPGPRILGN